MSTINTKPMLTQSENETAQSVTERIDELFQMIEEKMQSINTAVDLILLP